ncbi:cobalt-precorrin-5B (C(1))-methyltransferase CbiD [Peptostreptococcus equinus]|uniref:Cobalt-precorrin-5B C(1)-methyltransferase n=1 Tax=Peptostreptococcus equinus TaxID=3003601 RepID=A0ABY7JPQ9_9FIRM|nr:cobalt-precorrin-5B (C(1))-methyltransferase CbiD [Peptostreptococcus sp. CBA3647]WAW15095.1 cobalt-precorrin-5B (C(1))-methyltransferase CbiD [Peptostreptococcus sp. CBA3647]
MEKYIYVDGKKYRRGFTTGTCAAAASKAAAYILFTGKKIKKINVDTPKYKAISIEIENIDIEYFENKNIKSVNVGVIKDGGDDIDATHGMEICSKIEIIPISNLPKIRSKKQSNYLEITSSNGIGTVKAQGLSVECNRPAINPVPLKMIADSVQEIIEDLQIDIEKKLDKEKTFLITISAPRGEEIAKNTFNSNLGIEGGISIIGTTGIVEPMSDEGWKKALSLELYTKVKKGLDKIILVPGNIGYDAMVSKLKYSPDSIVKMSNFIGYMLMECKRLGFKKIYLAGHIGKLIKLSAGIMDSHNRIADARHEIMIANLALMGASLEILKEIEKCKTTDAMLKVIDKNNLHGVYEIIAQKAAERAWNYMRLDRKKQNIEIEIILFSMESDVLARSNYK